MNAEIHRRSQLNERAQHLLRVLVQSYIREGQPVGSRSLSRDSGLSLSSATIRNVMADLEELGFVTSPHTSAGRVPTDRATASSSTRCCKRAAAAPKPPSWTSCGASSTSAARATHGAGRGRLAAAVATSRSWPAS